MFSLVINKKYKTNYVLFCFVLDGVVQPNLPTTGFRTIFPSLGAIYGIFWVIHPCSLPYRFYVQFLFGLNEKTERWVRDGVFSGGAPLLSRSEDEIFYLLEDMMNFDYHWHLRQHNPQQHRDPLEDQL